MSFHQDFQHRSILTSSAKVMSKVNTVFRTPTITKRTPSFISTDNTGTHDLSLFTSQGPRGPFPPSIGFPGQFNNPVGFAAAPGYLGSLTAWPGGTGAQTISDGTHAVSGSGTVTDPWIFSFFDFDAQTHGTVMTVSHAKFIGCRFQSNQVNVSNTNPTGSDITFSYCSFTPRVALWSSPPNGAWPSAGAGLQIIPSNAAYTNTGGYCIPSSDGYQYGIHLPNGPLVLDHCDIWGFGNALDVLNTTSQITIRDCWMHDCANCNVTPPGGSTPYHTDGPGYLNGGTPPQNITIDHCTIAFIGNTNCIAFQSATSGYSNISVTRCYFSGNQNTVDMCHNTTGNTNLTFTDNIFATDLPWSASPLYTDFSAQFTGSTNKWRRNTLKVLSGTSPIGGSTFSFTSADDGKFLLPNITLSATDFTG